MNWVERFNDLAAQWGDTIWRASWQSGLLIAIVWLAGRVWRAMPNNLRCGLWIIACLRLLIGLTPISLAIACFPANVPAPLLPDLNLPTGIPASIPIRIPMPKVPPVSISTIAWIMVAWLLGVGLFAAFAVWRLKRTYRMAKRAQLCHDRELVGVAHQIRLSLGLRRNPALLWTEESKSVLTLGGVKPRILLSASVMEGCSDEEQQMVIAHELCHIARQDVWLGLIPQFAQTLFFFHPLAWLASREFDFAREAACDELAMQCLGVGSQPYGRLLLKLGTGDRSASTLSTPGVSSHFRLLRRRISMLEQASTRNRVLRRGHSLVVVCLAGIFGLVPVSLVQAQQSNYVDVISKNLPGPAAGMALPLKAAPVKVKNVSAKKPVVHGKQPVAIAKKNTSLPVSALPKVVTSTALAGKQANNPPAPHRLNFIPEPQLDVFHLKFAKASDVASMLTNAFAKNPESLNISAVEDSRTNSVVVVAQKSQMDDIRKVIVGLDIPNQGPTQIEPEIQTKIVQITYASADELSEVVKKLFGTTGIVADANTNTIILRLPPETIKEIERIFAQLDHAK